MNENPYAAPQTSPSPPDRPSGPGGELILVQFKQQARGLGALWIFLSILCVVAAFALAYSVEDRLDSVTFFVLIGITTFQALLYFALGVGCLLRQMWAVWTGLFAGSFALIAMVAGVAFGGGNCCGLLFFGAAVLQSYRLIGYANALRQRSISLNSN